MDYSKLGLKAGLEIHQQIEGKKLFCNCPTLLRDDLPHFTFKRSLRMAAGELGDVDIAAKHEVEKNRYFLYEAYKDTTCLVEFDEEPPHEMNKDALEVAMQVSLMLKARLIDEIQVMRKTVIDGSNTSGFQRTALIAKNGTLKTSQGPVSITWINLEEDAARIISEDKEKKVYRLDRLGIPLIEIGTGPDLKSPEQVREAAELIGMVLRSTGKVKRGIGTIRQDVNVSIKDGARVEIKGAQELKLLPKLVEMEAQRQYSLIEIAKELQLRRAKVDGKIHNITELLKNSQSKVIMNAIASKGVVLAMRLEGFAGLIGRELLPGRRLGTEFSECAKVKAGVGGIFHSDELPKYGITVDEVSLMRERLFCKEKDGFVLVADNAERGELALNAVIDRARQSVEGVPMEVRKANEDGTTSYLRPIPGAARMYPETDIRPTKPEVGKTQLPEMLSEKAKRFEKQYGLGDDLAEKIVSEGSERFEKFAARFNNIKPAYLAEILVSSIPEIVRTHPGCDISKITEDVFVRIFDALDKGKITKENVKIILTDIAEGKGFDLDRYKVLSDGELRGKIKEIIDKNKNLELNVLTGRIIGELRGKGDPQKMIELIKKLKSS